MSENNFFETAQGERYYRDELNFAEFPLAALSDSVPAGQKTLVFTDTIFDRSRHQSIDRKLTISASDEYGLPTAQDDEVILGLIQLSAKTGFENRKVHFTRRELIRELSWRDESKSYARVAESLKRWLGVALYYERAWWSNEERCWVDESFHILEHVTLFDRERIAHRKKALPHDPNAGFSSFTWNEAVFDSFEAGYLKKLDFNLYKSLRSSITKRLYRFLDKRLNRNTENPKLEFDLMVFAFEKIGLSRNYHIGEIKRRLKPSILELENCGLLEPLDEKERFVRKGRGEWRIVFVKSRSSASSKYANANVVGELVAFGVGRRTAERLAVDFTEKRIHEKLAVARWLRARSDARISKNPAGFLVAAIRNDYPAPKEFVGAIQPVAPVVVAGSRHLVQREQDRTSTQADAHPTQATTYWENLSSAEREKLEAVAVENAEKFLRDQYVDRKARGGSLYEAARQAILDREIRKRLSERRQL
jgi:hypothetical protein